MNESDVPLMNDDLLCAYLDGELDDSQRRAVDAVLAQDAYARLQLERLRATDARLRAAFPLIAVDDHDPLAARILAADVGSAAKPANRPVRMRPKRTWLAWAAGVVGIGLVAVLDSKFGNQARPGSVTASGLSPVIVAALDHRASGRLEADGLQLVLSFKASDGRYCRVFEQTVAGGTHQGLACHDEEGWVLIGLDAGAGGRDQFRPAGGNTTIDNLMDQLGAGAALEPADEQALIMQAWRLR